MKIKYQKPMAAVEFYKLSQSIASCTIKINSLSNACVVMDDDTPEEMRSLALEYETYFCAAGGCAKACDQSPDYDTLCYHTQVNATFIS